MNKSIPSLLKVPFNEKHFLENLLLDEQRELYSAMSREQKMLVRHAYSFGALKQEAWENRTRVEAEEAHEKRLRDSVKQGTQEVSL